MGLENDHCFVRVVPPLTEAEWATKEPALKTRAAKQRFQYRAPQKDQGRVVGFLVKPKPGVSIADLRAALPFDVGSIVPCRSTDGSVQARQGELSL